MPLSIKSDYSFVFDFRIKELPLFRDYLRQMFKRAFVFNFNTLYGENFWEEKFLFKKRILSDFDESKENTIKRQSLQVEELLEGEEQEHIYSDWDISEGFYEEREFSLEEIYKICDLLTFFKDRDGNTYFGLIDTQQFEDSLFTAKDIFRSLDYGTLDIPAVGFFKEYFSFIQNNFYNIYREFIENIRVEREDAPNERDKTIRPGSSGVREEPV